MGEFRITYNYVCNRNIQYMYAGNRAMLKRGYDYPNFDMLRLRRENTALKKNILRSNNSNQEREFTIPKAPAFRNFSRFAVTDMVDRLQNPTLSRKMKSSQESIASSVSCPRTASSDYEYPTTMAKEQYGHRALPKEQVDMIVNRLVRQHTVMSEMKQKQKFQGHVAPLQLVEVAA